MPAIRPIKQKELIRFLRKLDFIGPYSGGKHQFMVRGDLRIRIPNPHKKDIGKNLLKIILKEAEISKETWEKLYNVFIKIRVNPLRSSQAFFMNNNSHVYINTFYVYDYG